MTPDAIRKIELLEAVAEQHPQIDIPIEHTLHAGVYARTAYLPRNALIVGAAIRVPTILIVSGDATMTTEDGPRRITGYEIFKAPAGRKTAFFAHEETEITMLFATDARTVRDAEDEFTADADKLQSRKGEQPCQV